MVYPKLKVKYLTFLYVLFINTGLCAQTPGYWQQEVSYDISVQLNDNEHVLNGFITIDYTNNSPDKLDHIYFHLWPNAYKNGNTAFAKQVLAMGKTNFYYANKSERGYIDSLRFTVNNIPVKVVYDSVNIDICNLILNRPLEPGEKTTIRTPFKVKLPESFSRMGHTGQSYQISQWYPKPAVYDREGWHPIPYLDQGEFYSEYGTFDVHITLPKNYVVGASGDLQNEEERHWLDSLAILNRKALFPVDTPIIPPTKLSKARANMVANDPRLDTFPQSAKETKTLNYHLEKAHDFAWFADKRYLVLKDSVILPNSGRKVTTWAMFTRRRAAIWKNATEYINGGIFWYSKWIGDYPYDIATAVEGGLSAGSGMEYPTITVIGGLRTAFMVEDVIVHEIGHNWFYGVLGTNERKHPWMDEGINTYYEYRYLNQQYPDKKLLNIKKGAAAVFDIDQYPHTYTAELTYRYLTFENEDQPIELPAAEYTPGNYGGIVYMKTALALKHLKGYLGNEAFDKGMQAYFEQWKFKHPMPKDMQQTLEKSSGKSLSWLFDSLMPTTRKVDYAITKAKHADDDEPMWITVHNRGGLNVPFSLSGLVGDTVKKTVWYVGCSNDTTVLFPAGKYDFYRIDGNQEMVEANRKNDTYRTRGLLHRAERIRFQFLASVDNPYKNQLYFAPIVGWNDYDKTLVGFAFYNHFAPGKHFEYELVPMIGTASRTFAGFGRMGYTWTPRKSKLRTINFSVYGKRFSYQLAPDVLNYNKIQPQLTFNIHPKNALSVISHQVIMRSVTVFMNETDYEPILWPEQGPAYTKVIKNIHYTVNEAKYTLTASRTINPYSIEGSLQQGNNFVRFSGEARVQLTYEQPGKGFTARLFGGGFLWDHTTSGVAPDPGFRLGYGTGSGQFQKDYLFDELFLGRNPSSLTFLSQQVIEKDGGFRMPNMNYGNSVKTWIIALNLSATLPKQIPLRPYLNIGAYGGKTYNSVAGTQQSYTTTVIEGGVRAVVIPDAIEINFPLFMVVNEGSGSPIPSGSWYVGMKSDASGNIFKGRKYHQMISFVLNLNKLNPFNLIKDLKL